MPTGHVIGLGFLTMGVHISHWENGNQNHKEKPNHSHRDSLQLVLHNKFGKGMGRSKASPHLLAMR